MVPKMCNDMMNVGRLQGFDVRSHVTASRFYFMSCFCPFLHIDLTSPSGLLPFAGEDRGSGPPAAAGHLHGVGPGGRSPRPHEGEESLPVRAAGDLQRAARQEERLLPAGLPIQEQHQGERWTKSVCHL